MSYNTFSSLVPAVLRTRLCTKQTSNHHLFLGQSLNLHYRAKKGGKGLTFKTLRCVHTHMLCWPFLRPCSSRVYKRRKNISSIFSFPGPLLTLFPLPHCLSPVFKVTPQNSTVQQVFPDPLTVLTGPFVAPPGLCTTPTLALSTLHHSCLSTCLLTLLVSSLRTGLVSILSSTAGVPNPQGRRPLTVRSLLGTGSHSRRWAAGEQSSICHSPPLTLPPEPSPHYPTLRRRKNCPHKTGPWCQKG